MRDRRLDVQGLLIQGLEFLVVLLGSVHLNLQSIDFQQLRSFLQIILALICLQQAYSHCQKHSKHKAPFFLTDISCYLMLLSVAPTIRHQIVRLLTSNVFHEVRKEMAVT
jgi:hypothetical protein